MMTYVDEESQNNHSSFNDEEEINEDLTSFALDGVKEFDVCENEEESKGWSEAVEDDPCTLNDICGLNQIKETLLNIFVYPAMFPHLFPRKIRWNQILFYGPPGTGKTMLAKAIAVEMNANFHRVSSADLLSHWQGESEKQIRNLFRQVRNTPNTTILFFDEIDGLCRRRNTNEDDNIRRIKTELLTQFDDCRSAPNNCHLYILGATNCPWEIDFGFMRRFHKKIYVPLPEKNDRVDIMKRNFEGVETSLTDAEWDAVGVKTDGYSCCDLVNVVMASCCERFLTMKKCKYWEAKGDLWIPATSNSVILTRMDFDDIPQNKVGERSITLSDVETAISSTAKTVSSDELKRYLEYSSSCA